MAAGKAAPQLKAAGTSALLSEKSSPPAAAEPSGYRSPQAGRFVWHRPRSSPSGVFLALPSYKR